MTQYHYPRPSGTAQESSTAPATRAPVPEASMRAEVRRLREVIDSQAQEIQELRRDLRRMREQINQHANTINRINRG